ncbi:hypothetical protein [uncultured Cohaesibacter sp.]|uniref:hypothetical protein n=1 Tax=uncultured Cohaesibacter sp. TaxID=1002546 RepID=UPI00292F3C74|nr:hypothetical protein [uncultured Cohaesibacter sp.]
MKLLRVVLVLSSLLQLFLFYQLLAMPEAIIAGFGIPESASAEMIARRAGILFLVAGLFGLVMAWKVKGRQLMALSLVMAIGWLAMASESAFEWSRGFAGDGTLMPMGAEALFGLLMLLACLRMLWMEKRK